MNFQFETVSCRGRHGKVGVEPGGDEESDSEVVITGWTPPERPVGVETQKFNLCLPKNVLAVQKGAFRACSLIDQVEFEADSKLFRIEAEAFEESSLRNISIPSAVELIGKVCFNSCTELEDVWFGKGSRLQRLGAGAFASTALKSIVIPSSVECISENCFRGCARLEVVAWHSGGHSLKHIGNCAFAQTGLRKIVIPNSLELISDGCFAECKQLESVSFEADSSLKRIGKQAFCQTMLKEVVIPDGVDVLDENCFRDCTRLEAVVINVPFTKLREHVEGTGLCDVTLPASVRFIGDYCFSGCKSLTTFKSKNSEFTRIGVGALSDTAIVGFTAKSARIIDNRAFADCPWLSLWVLNNTVWRLDIAEEQFVNASRLKKFVLPSTTVKIGRAAFRKSGLESLDSSRNVVVQEIGDEAFAYTESLLNLTIPTSLRSIGKRAFAGSRLSECQTKYCLRLRRIDDEAFKDTQLACFELPKTVVTMGRDVFDGCKMKVKPCIDMFGEEAMEVDLVRFSGCVDGLSDWELIRAHKYIVVDFTDTVMMIGHSITDSFKDTCGMSGWEDLMMSSERPLLRDDDLCDLLKVQVLGYLVDYQFSRIQGYRLDTTLWSCAYLYVDVELKDSLFDMVLSLFVECGLEMENVWSKLMAAGAVVTSEWRESKMIGVDGQPISLDQWPIARGLRRCPNINSFFQQEEPADEVRKRIWRFGAFEVRFIRFLRLFTRDTFTHEYAEEAWKFFDDGYFDIPDIDDVIEQDQTISDGDSETWRVNYEGFYPEYSRRFGAQWETYGPKLPHAKVKEGYIAFRETILNMRRVCQKLKMMMEKGAKPGCAMILRWMTQWVSRHETEPSFVRFLCILLLLPHNWVKQKVTKESDSGKLFLPFLLEMSVGPKGVIDEEAQRERKWTVEQLVSNDLERMRCAPVGKAKNSIIQREKHALAAITSFCEYSIRLLMFTPARSVDSYEDLLLARWHSFVDMYYAREKTVVIRMYTLLQLLNYTSVCVKAGIHCEPVPKVMAFAYMAALYEQLEICSRELTGDDIMSGFYHLLSEYLFDAARMLANAAKLDVESWQELKTWSGFAMMIRINSSMKARRMFVLPPNGYFYMKVGACFRTLYQCIRDSEELDNELKAELEPKKLDVDGVMDEFNLIWLNMNEETDILDVTGFGEYLDVSNEWYKFMERSQQTGFTMECLPTVADCSFPVPVMAGRESPEPVQGNVSKYLRANGQSRLVQAILRANREAHDTAKLETMLQSEFVQHQNDDRIFTIGLHILSRVFILDGHGIVRKHLHEVFDFLMRGLEFFGSAGSILFLGISCSDLSEAERTRLTSNELFISCFVDGLVYSNKMIDKGSFTESGAKLLADVEQKSSKHQK